MVVQPAALGDYTWSIEWSALCQQLEHGRRRGSRYSLPDSDLHLAWCIRRHACTTILHASSPCHACIRVWIVSLRLVKPLKIGTKNGPSSFSSPTAPSNPEEFWFKLLSLDVRHVWIIAIESMDWESKCKVCLLYWRAFITINVSRGTEIGD